MRKKIYEWNIYIWINDQKSIYSNVILYNHYYRRKRKKKKQILLTL